MMTMNRSYTGVMEFDTYEGRLKYLKLGGEVGKETFGYDRYLNQVFYKSPEWKSIRHKVIVRDGACDLGIPDREIYGNILVHHINPITIMDILNKDPKLFDMDNLICTTKKTHDSIHYGNRSVEPGLIERSQNDTVPWKRGDAK